MFRYSNICQISNASSIPRVSLESVEFPYFSSLSPRPARGYYYYSWDRTRKKERKKGKGKEKGEKKKKRKEKKTMRIRVLAIKLLRVVKSYSLAFRMGYAGSAEAMNFRFRTP